MRHDERKRPILQVAAAGLAVALLTQSPAGAQQPPAQPIGPDAVAAAIGQIIYQRYCGACHGDTARGNGSIAKDLVVPPTDLTLLAKKNGGKFPYQKLVEIIDGRRSARGHGTPDMPVWGEVFGKTKGIESPDIYTAEVRIAHYLWSIQQK